MGLSFLVTGGYLDGSGEGIVWHVDLERERAEPFVRWQPPPHLLVPGKGFAGGCLAADGTLYAAAHCAIVRIDAARAAVSGVLHQPSFNDLHHLTVSQEGRLYIANTGLCSVDVHDTAGRFVGSHSLLPSWVNRQRMNGEDPSRFEPLLDAGWQGAIPPPWPTTRQQDGYNDGGHSRRDEPFARLKVPDYLHFNHVCLTPTQTLVTCLYDGTVRDLRTFETVLDVPGSYPHDGFISSGMFWTTGIDGRVRATPLQGGQVRGQPEVKLSVFDTGHAGWCRGLWTDGRLLAVGLTEVRRGYMPRHRWADREPEGTETSVLLVEVSSGRLLARVELSDGERHSKLYSILPVPGSQG